MTNNQHGQVPEALIDLIDAYAETRHRYGRIYNARTEAARKAVIEALSGVQALSAAPAGFVPVAAFDRLHAHAESLAARLLAASPTPPAEQPIGEVVVTKTKDGQIVSVTRQDDEGRILSVIATSDPAEQPDLTQLTERGAKAWAGVDAQALRDGTYQQAAPKAAPGVGNSGFDHQTAADFLSGKTVSDKALRKFIAASRGAHDDRAALRTQMLALRDVLASREAEIALLKKALMEAEAAPQQEAQEPVAWQSRTRPTWGGNTRPWSPWEPCTKEQAEDCWKTPLLHDWAYEARALFTAPQPAPAPLSDADLVELGKSEKSGLYPWGIGTTRADYLRAVRAVLDASRKQGANHD